MSKLYVRVQTGFYTHRKTVKLRLRLGNDAYWLPPRLWAYAAENQPDGDMSAYSAEELAELVGYSSTAKSNAQAMLQALKDSGFIDESGFINDWAEYNGYHKMYSERAKKAALAMWAKRREKEKSPTPPKEDIGQRTEESGDKQSTSNAPSIKAPPARKTPKATSLSDEEFLISLESNPTYEGLKVRQEYGKMITWCSANNREPNRRRFINWINRCDRPMKINGKSTSEPNYQNGF